MSAKRFKVNDPKNIARTIVIVESCEIPVSTDYVAHKLGVSWSTAKSLLFELALNGKVKAQKTTKSWIFSRSESVKATLDRLLTLRDEGLEL